MYFTQQEFNKMLDELLDSNGPVFDTLFAVAKKNLTGFVNRLCSLDEFLRNGGYEEDIMQEIYIKLLKGTVTFLMKHTDENGHIDTDPIRFKAWLFTVAKSAKSDFAKKVRREKFMIVTPITNDDEDEGESDGDLINGLPGYEGEEPEKITVVIEDLKWSVDVVLSADVKVYKILTWLALLILLRQYERRLDANKMVVLIFEDMTLFEMYQMILSAAQRIPWLELTTEQCERIVADLDESFNDELKYGDVKFNEFFMKNKGVKDGKKSVSDWMNRMTDRLNREYSEFLDEDSIKEKKKAKNKKKKEGRSDNDGSSED